MHGGALQPPSVLARQRNKNCGISLTAKTCLELLENVVQECFLTSVDPVKFAPRGKRRGEDMFATPAMDPGSVRGRTSMVHVFGDLLCNKCRSKKKKVRVGIFCTPLGRACGEQRSEIHIINN